jgi:hypothetical protein
MKCLYCGQRLALLRKLTDSEFCSSAHRRQFYRDQEQLALSRLVDAQKRFSVVTGLNVEVARPVAQVAPPVTRAIAKPAAAEAINGFVGNLVKPVSGAVALLKPAPDPVEQHPARNLPQGVALLEAPKVRLAAMAPLAAASANVDLWRERAVLRMRAPFYEPITPTLSITNQAGMPAAGRVPCLIEAHAASPCGPPIDVYGYLATPPQAALKPASPEIALWSASLSMPGLLALHAPPHPYQGCRPRAVPATATAFTGAVAIPRGMAAISTISVELSTRYAREAREMLLALLSEPQASLADFGPPCEPVAIALAALARAVEAAPLEAVPGIPMDSGVRFVARPASILGTENLSWAPGLGDVGDLPGAVPPVEGKPGGASLVPLEVAVSPAAPTARSLAAVAPALEFVLAAGVPSMDGPQAVRGEETTCGLEATPLWPECGLKDGLDGAGVIAPPAAAPLLLETGLATSDQCLRLESPSPVCASRMRSGTHGWATLPAAEPVRPVLEAGFDSPGVAFAPCLPLAVSAMEPEISRAAAAPGWLSCEGADSESDPCLGDGVEIELPEHDATPQFGPPAAKRLFTLYWAEPAASHAMKVVRRDAQSLPAEPKPLVPQSRLQPYRDGEGRKARVAAGMAPMMPLPLPAARRDWNFAPLWRQVTANARWIALTLPIVVGLLFYVASPGSPRMEEHAAAAGKTEGGAAGQWGKFRQVLLKRAAIELSDDFRGGLADWEGAPGWSNAWSYDPAGFVMTGPMALFRPTMEMTDYRIEFLGQIEKKGLGWAFRAADLKNYYAMKLVVAKPGPVPTMMVESYAVVNGVEGPRTRTPLPLLVRQDTLYRVRVDVRGSQFTVYVQGQMVTHWSDERLKSGGIGFFSAKGEQARLRWVEVQHQYDALGRLCAFLAPYGLPAREGKQ